MNIVTPEPESAEPESAEWHAERAVFWQEECARRERRLIEAQDELRAAKRALREHEAFTGK